MKVFWTIVKRDLTGFFMSPVFYAMATIFLILTGLLFFSNILVYQQISFSVSQSPYVSQSLTIANDFFRPFAAQFAVILLFFMPILTMRSFSEEKRNGTLELLLTYPVSDIQAISGKFCAVCLAMIAILSITLIYPIMLIMWSEPELGPIVTCYVGVLGIVAMFAAIGVFASAMTENQIVAALLAFGLNLVFWMIGWASPESSGLLHDTLTHLSLITHFEPMIKGIFRLTDIVYFFTGTLLFLFLTGQVLESRKWRG